MVTSRKKVGILFSYSEGWIGGSYYFINLVCALNLLPDEQKPHVVILSDSEKSYNIILETGYPYLSYLNSHFKYNITERVINKLSKLITGSPIIHKGYSVEQLPVLFGYYEQLVLHKCVRNIYWIPDLQDCHYPEYLGSEVADGRKRQHLKLAYSNQEVVFSSEDSKKDFDTFYPASVCKKSVVQFAVTLPDISNESYSSIAAKFKISGPYYFSPNQFWKHKNHMVIIKAVEKLKENGKDITVVFTGNESTGNGEYARELKNYVNNNGLQANCLFLGFIDRKEQLVLMRESIAVIQPSVFEGWSTVVEDAKALNKFIFVSDIGVHHEQLKDNAQFFDPGNALCLSELLFSGPSGKLIPANYQSNITNYGKNFINAVFG